MDDCAEKQGVEQKAPIPISDQSLVHAGLHEKPNSGDESDWKLVTKKDCLIFLPNPYEACVYQERSELIANVPKGVGIPLVLWKGYGARTLASKRSVLHDNNDIWVVKMWGFSGITKFANPELAYCKAVYALLNGALGVKGLHELMRDRVRTAEPPSILLTFDGDPACEKTGEKMSHCLFAPMVAEKLRRFLGLPVHLMILKIDEDKESDDIFDKFVDENPSDGSYAVRVSPPKSGASAHFYPSFTTDFFESCTIHVKKVASVAESEVQTSQMLTELLGERITHRCCLCVGSNSKESVLAMRKRESAKFDLAVRIHLYSLFAPRVRKDC